MRLGIVGPGLIGRSIALAAARAQADLHVVEIDRGQPLDPLAGCDIVVLAPPVDAIVDILQSHADILRAAVTIDTGSTKKAIIAAARSVGLQWFVGGHPMTGAATSGPSGARADLFDGRTWFLLRGAASHDTVERASRFVTQLGARPVIMSDDGSEHDRVMAAVSHLPQVVASALMIVVTEAAGDRLEWAGNGLRDTTRLAGSAAAIWESVLSTNAAELKPLLLELAASLSHVAERLDDPAAVRDLFERANEARRRFDGTAGGRTQA